MSKSVININCCGEIKEKVHREINSGFKQDKAHLSFIVATIALSDQG